MPDCKEYEELCSAYVDHALSRAEKQAFEAHLAACPDCQAYVEELRALRALWRSIETPAPEGLHARIMQQIEDEVRAQTPVTEPAAPPRRRRVPAFTLLAAAAACLVLAVSGSLPSLLSAQADPAVQTDLVTGTAPDVQTDAAADAGSVPQTAIPEPVGGQRMTAPAAADEGADAPKQKADAQEAAPSTQAADPVQPAEPPEEPAADVPADSAAQPAADSRSVPADGSALAQTPMAMSVTPAPEALTGMAFANCYSATYPEGESGTVPVLEGASLLVTEDGVSYYRVDNNESKIAAALETLSGAGFTVAVSGASPVVLEREAEAVLLMVTVGS